LERSEILMRQVKIVIIGLFFLIFLGSVSNQFLSPTVTGQSGLSAPTGVVASDGSYINKVGLNWDAIRGATTYRILRNTVNDSAGAVSVGTTANNLFLDNSAVAGQNYFYWVRAEDGAIVSGLSQAEPGFRAIGQVQGPVPPLEPPPPAPSANQTTAAKVFLGKALFWDEQLSSTRTVSCGTCHRGGKGGSDPRSIFNNARSTNPGFDSIAGTTDDVYGSPGVPLSTADGLYEWSTQYGLKEQVTGRKSGRASNRCFPRPAHAGDRLERRRGAGKSGRWAAGKLGRDGTLRTRLDPGRIADSQFQTISAFARVTRRFAELGG
jgi:hypothetical protein